MQAKEVEDSLIQIVLIWGPKLNKSQPIMIKAIVIMEVTWLKVLIYKRNVGILDQIIQNRMLIKKKIT